MKVEGRVCIVLLHVIRKSLTPSVNRLTAILNWKKPKSNLGFKPGQNAIALPLVPPPLPKKFRRTKLGPSKMWATVKVYLKRSNSLSRIAIINFLYIDDTSGHIGKDKWQLLKISGRQFYWDTSATKRSTVQIPITSRLIFAVHQLWTLRILILLIFFPTTLSALPR